jgi:phosphopantetheinyl transferase (holo-ACP synthase)
MEGLRLTAPFHGFQIAVACVATRTPNANLAGSAMALEEIFASERIPDVNPETDLRWQSDPLGKPILSWTGELERWAAGSGLGDRHLHVSNSHDREFHFVAVAYGGEIAGIGVDVVALDRLRRRDRGYLLRFARRFMSDAEWKGFEQASRELAWEELIVRTAAHFSLMEAASKALGTGLALGLGLGRLGSLPARSIGVVSLEPRVEMLFEPPAVARMDLLGAAGAICHWEAAADHLLATVILIR